MTKEEAKIYVREHTPEETVAFYKATVEKGDSLRRSIKVACKAYFADIAQKKDRVNDQINSLKNRSSDLNTERTKLKESLLIATVKADATAVSEIQRRMADNKAELLSIPDQIHALESSGIPGSKELYDAVLVACNDLHAFKKEGLIGTIYDEVDRISMLYEASILHHNQPMSSYDPDQEWKNEVEKVKLNFSGKDPSCAKKEINKYFPFPK